MRSNTSTLAWAGRVEEQALGTTMLRALGPSISRALEEYSAGPMVYVPAEYTVLPTTKSNGMSAFTLSSWAPAVEAKSNAAATNARLKYFFMTAPPFFM